MPGPLDSLYNEEEKATINGLQSPVVSAESELRGRLRSANLGSFCEHHRKLLKSTQGIMQLRKQAMRLLAFLSQFASSCAETGIKVDMAIQQFGHKLRPQESHLYRPAIGGADLKMTREEYQNAYENAQELQDFMPVRFCTQARSTASLIIAYFSCAGLD
jgi:hypothetical protein